jgi:hypothetical protein
MAQNYDDEVEPIDGDLWHKYTDNFELQRDEVIRMNLPIHHRKDKLLQLSNFRFLLSTRFMRTLKTF